MASSINASTSGAGGLITTADNTGILNLQTAGTTAVTVDASQNIGISNTGTNTVQVIIGNGSASTAPQLYINGGTSGANGPGIYGQGAGSTEWLIASLRSATGGGATGMVDYVYGANPRVFYTNGSERMRIDSTGYVTNAVNGLGNGLHQAYQYYRLNSGYAGANVNTVQSIFGVGVTLVGSTVYEFELVVAFSKTAGTTSHTFALGFGGTATLNNIGYLWTGNGMDSSFTLVGATGQTNFIQTASATVVTAAQTAASRYFYLIIKGTVSINAGGTFIPQYTLSAAPGGAYTTQIGSYIKISPLSASGANTSVGTWA